MEKKSYSNDRSFLERHLRLIELADGSCRLLVCPGLQGRVMTSTADGESSFGWINYSLLESGSLLPHCNNWGGEDRFWLGPEGGQFSLFFPKGTSFAFEDWQTPALIDTEEWKTGETGPTSVSFSKEAVLTNCSGHRLALRLDRKVCLQEPPCRAEGTEAVSFRSENRITNMGDTAWDETTGMPSIWMLGQFLPSDRNVLVIPYREAAGAAINDSYFGRIGEERLRSDGKVLFFRGDGRKRGKIGIPPEMVIPTAGAYDPEHGSLTVISFSLPEAPSPYVNSMWEYQKEPFRGDVLNAYNDGPLEDGSIMGPFYELESSSPAAALRPGESLLHTHCTTHYTGPESGLDFLARRLLGTGLDRLEDIFCHR